MAPLQGVIRSMPEYPVHIRAGVHFPRSGREFVVVTDAKAFEEPAKEARKLYEDAVRTGAPAESGDKPVVFHVVEADDFTKRERKVEKRGRLIDIPGKPLVLDADAYAYLLQASGTLLVFEPIGGDPMQTAARAAALETENEKLRARIAELEKPAKK